MTRLTRSWAQFGITVGAALVAAIAVVALLPNAVLFPAYCSDYPSRNAVPIQPGQWCINYDPNLGRYENPPAAVPADMSQAATASARPNDVRLVIGAATLLLVATASWWLLGRFGGPANGRRRVTFGNAD